MIVSSYRLRIHPWVQSGIAAVFKPPGAMYAWSHYEAYLAPVLSELRARAHDGNAFVDALLGVPLPEVSGGEAYAVYFPEHMRVVEKLICRGDVPMKAYRSPNDLPKRALVACMFAAVYTRWPWQTEAQHAEQARELEAIPLVGDAYKAWKQTIDAPASEVGGAENAAPLVWAVRRQRSPKRARA